MPDRDSQARRGNRWVLLFGMGAVLSLSAACDASGRTVTYTSPQVSFRGTLVSELAVGGDPYLDCAWLEDDAGHRVVIIVPGDILFRPTRIVDEDGAVVATEGDLVEVTGPEEGVGGSVCSDAAPFLADSVRRVR